MEEKWIVCQQCNRNNTSIKGYVPQAGDAFGSRGHGATNRKLMHKQLPIICFTFIEINSDIPDNILYPPQRK